MLDYQQLFHEFNERYFASRLKPYRVKVVDRISGGLDASGLHLKHKGRILLGRSCAEDPEQGVTTLLHEMVHAAKGDHHGPKFIGEVRRLRAAGAPIADSEDQFRHTVRLTRGEVLESAQEAHHQDGPAKLQDFIRWFARDRGMSQAAFRRRYWWVPKVFADARKEVAQHKKYKREFLKRNR